MDSGSSPNIPAAPNLKQLFKQGVGLNSKFMPKWLRNEMRYRSSEDPRRIQHQQDLQAQFGPRQYQQMLEGFKALDPTFYKNREQLGTQVSTDLAKGTQLTPAQRDEIEQNVLRSQARTGNIAGSAANLADAYTVGSKGLELYQQRLGNMGQYLSMPTMAAQAGATPPVSPDRSFAYENPNAGWQMVNAGMQNYQNQLGQATAGQGSGGNPWMSAIGGVLQAVGPILGAVAFSDRRLKTNIKKVGTAPSGSGIYEYNYKGPRMRGPIAQDVAKHIPGAVGVDPISRYKTVALHKIDVPMERIA